MSTSNEVWHDLLSRAKRQVLEDRKAFGCNIACHLVRESLQLAEADTVALSQIILVTQRHRLVASLRVVTSDENNVLVAHITDYMLHATIIAFVSVFDRVPDW